MASMTSSANAGPGLRAFGAQLGFTEMQQELLTLYDVDRSIANFDAGYYGAMTKAVHAAYQRNIGWVNRFNSVFLRNAVPGASRNDLLDVSREGVARLLGASREEIALGTCATDALYSLITNYALLKPGDAVVYCDVDYDEMQFAMEYLEQSRGARIVRFSLPEPYTSANVYEAYERVLQNTPRARLLLLTHVSNRNGLIPPVKEIIAMAKRRGVDVILDSAHALGQMPFTVDETGADFIGFSLHKWLAAPLGCGGIFIRKERLQDIGPWLGNRLHDVSDVRARLSTGTLDFAAHLTIPDALAVQEGIGLPRKFQYLRSLRDHWVSRARDIEGVEIMLPAETQEYGAICAFRLPGMKTHAQAELARTAFLQKHGILVVNKGGLASGPVLRVTPSLFNTTAELDHLVQAMQSERRLLL